MLLTTASMLMVIKLPIPTHRACEAAEPCSYRCSGRSEILDSRFRGNDGASD
jgi:hypothetical protein